MSSSPTTRHADQPGSCANQRDPSTPRTTRAVASASAAKANLRRRAVAAFVRGDQATQLIAVMGDPLDYSRGQRYLEALADSDQLAALRDQLLGK